MSGFIVLTPLGMVSGFSDEHQVVQTTEDQSLARKFPSWNWAKLFISKYGDAGYGLSSDLARIREIE